MKHISSVARPHSTLILRIVASNGLTELLHETSRTVLNHSVTHLSQSPILIFVLVLHTRHVETY
jgi:hypothetical protein